MLPPPTNLTFTALNFTSAMLSWLTSGSNPDCFYGYDVIIQSNTSMAIHNSTTITTTLNVTGFTRGVEYTVSVYGIDNNGRLGKNGTILMTLDGMYRASALISWVYPLYEFFIFFKLQTRLFYNQRK